MVYLLGPSCLCRGWQHRRVHWQIHSSNWKWWRLLTRTRHNCERVSLNELPSMLRLTIYLYLNAILSCKTSGALSQTWFVTAASFIIRGSRLAGVANYTWLTGSAIAWFSSWSTLKFWVRRPSTLIALLQRLRIGLIWCDPIGVELAYDLLAAPPNHQVTMIHPVRRLFHRSINASYPYTTGPLISGKICLVTLTCCCCT